MRVLIAAGGAAGTDAALSFGAWISRRTGAPPVVVSVVKREADRGRAAAILDDATRTLRDLGLAAEARVRQGHPAEEIVAEAEGGPYALVVVGERQHRGLRSRFRLGSTAVRVVEHAPCPVAVAKGSIGPIERILLCDSGVKEPTLTERFRAQLGRLARPSDRITILHVMSQMGAGPGVSGGDLRAEAAELIDDRTPEGELLDHAVITLVPLGARVSPKVRHGTVVDEILDEAREGAHDLVVIGAFRGEGWRRILLDDLAHQIIVRLDRPVLVVR